MLGSSDAEPPARIDPSGVPGHEVGLFGCEVLEPGGTGPGETDAARQPVDVYHFGSEEVGEGAAGRSLQELELKGSILAMAEANTERGVVVAVGVDVWDAKAVPVHGDLRRNASDGDLSVVDDLAPSQSEEGFCRDRYQAAMVRAAG